MTSETIIATEDEQQRRVRPPVERWILVGMLVLAALVSFGANAYLSSAAVDATAGSFARARMPGTITTTMHPGEWKVWLEGPGTVDRVEVVDGQGRSIEVDQHLGDIDYRHDGFEARPVASFTVPRGGLSAGVVVTVTGSADVIETAFAVGPSDEFGYVDLARYGTVLVIGLILLVAATIIVVPILRSRRNP